MAFILKDLVLPTIGLSFERKNIRNWKYFTDDDAGKIEVVGYFNDAYNELGIGDVIEVRAKGGTRLVYLIENIVGKVVTFASITPTATTIA